MKTIIRIFTLTIALIFTSAAFSQNPPHPNGGNAPSGDENRVGHGPNGAPIGSGMVMLLSLAAFYGSKKFINNKGKTDDNN